MILKSILIIFSLVLLISTLDICASDNYVAPNEMTPGQLIGPLKKATSGTYISVGSERGFWGASLNNKINGLVLIDQHADVVNYNKINLILLKISKSIEHYRYLRLNASLDEIIHLMRKKRFSHESIELFTDKFIWWNNIKNSKTFKVFNSKPGADSSFGKAFKYANYMWNENQYKNIKRLADNNSVVVTQLSLDDNKALAKFIKTLKKNDIRLSVLDLSNAYDFFDRRKDNYTNVLNSFKQIADDKSIHVLTEFDTSKQSLYKHVPRWKYQVTTFEEISKTGLRIPYTANPILIKIDRTYRNTKVAPKCISKILRNSINNHK